MESVLFFKDRLVAFIDILGFKNKVEDSLHNASSARNIFDALKRINQVKIDNQNMKKKYEMYSKGIEVTTFSDSAVISYPAEKDNLFHLVLDLIHLQLDLAVKNVLIRGGVTVGKLYHDGDIVYGPAMNQAYKLESQVAVYPRIIIDKHAIDQYYQLSKGDKYDIQDLESLIRRDYDGLFHVDMLKQDQEMNDCGTEYYDWLMSLRDIIVKGLEEPDIAVRVKYQWLQLYYNEVVTDDSAYMSIPSFDNENEMKDFRDSYAELRI